MNSDEVELKKNIPSLGTLKHFNFKIFIMRNKLEAGLIVKLLLKMNEKHILHVFLKQICKSIHNKSFMNYFQK